MKDNDELLKTRQGLNTTISGLMETVKNLNNINLDTLSDQQKKDFAAGIEKMNNEADFGKLLNLQKKMNENPFE